MQTQTLTSFQNYLDCIETIEEKGYDINLFRGQCKKSTQKRLGVACFGSAFGLKTRLLDWTSNPLVALWFACSNEYKMTANSCVYALSVNNDMLVNLSENESPFQNARTKVLRPTLNNERIIAQSGWFTAHRYSKTNKAFVTLETHRKMKTQIIAFEIPADLKESFLKKLSMFGVNSRTIYPDVTGLCLHLNWKYQNESTEALKSKS